MSHAKIDLQNAKALKRALSQPRLVNEVHFLCWRPPFKNGSHLDAGWMCREHALIAASLGALMGFSAHLAWGKVALVGDVEGQSVRQIMKTDPHSWAMFESVGICDLSLNLVEAPGIRWKPWPISVLAMGHPQLHLAMYGHDESEKWERAIDAASHTGGFHIVYLGGSIEPLSVRYLKGALEHINSPLSDELRNLGDIEIYSKAVRHLWEVHNRRRNCLSISGISQSDAWKRLSTMASGATEWITQQAHLPLD